MKLHIRGFCLPVVALILIGAAVSTARAQATPGNNVIAVVFNPEGKGATAKVFSAGKPEGTELLKVPEGMNILVASDAKSYILFGTVDQAGTFAAKYGTIGQPGAEKSLPIAKGFTFVGGNFSTDSKQFAYTLALIPEASGGNSAWTFNVLDLASGKLSTYTGNFVYPTDASGKANPLPPIGFYGAPLAISWHDSSHLMVNSFVPFVESSLGGPFLLDLSKANGATLPASTPLTRRPLPALSFQVIAPDNQKIAYSYSDPKRPVPNYQAEGPIGAFNTVSIVELASGRESVVAAPKDQAIASVLAWTADSTQVIFVSGPYKQDPTAGSVMVQPKLYTLDVTTGKTTEGPVMTPDDASTLVSLMVCGSNLYASIEKTTNNTNELTLYSAPLADPKTLTPLTKTSNSFISLLSCTP